MQSSDPTRITFTGSDDLTLVADRRGAPGERNVVFLHGGGQTRYSWGGTAAAVAERGWCSWTVDARGHGESDWSPTGDYRLSKFAADVAAVMSEIGDRPALVGASLGGLTSLLLLGQDAPGASRGLVLVDIVPNMEKKGTDRIASFMMANAESGFASLEEAADAVAAYNHHRDRPPSIDGLRKNLRERDGRWYWHWDPKFISPAADRGPSEINDPTLLMNCAKAIPEPMMLVRGRMSDVVSPEGAVEFVDEVPNAEFVDVSEAGHMVAGDRNDAFTAAVTTFLDGFS
ncbi:MAG: alpha/beta hydrolase [Acidimicrobiales bacterium]|jgi:peroxiredoxin|nr:alpha/beta hydrolase [Acidimicrobiales bacterium]